MIDGTRLLLLVCYAIAGQAVQDSGYLKPNTPEVGGAQHICLIYHGQERREHWTGEALLPYVAYVDETGTASDWLFDSFLFLEFATDEGASLYHDNGKGPYPTIRDWQWLIDAWFRKQAGLIGLQQAVETAGEALDDNSHRAGVIVSVPLPQSNVRQFGPLPSEKETLDFADLKDRQKALAWYVDTVWDRYHKANYSRLKLLGFYWTPESIPASDNALVEWLAGYIHEKGAKFYWIPYYNGRGAESWRDRGFDAMMLQPNHFFHEKSHRSRLAKAAQRAQAVGSGIEMEFDDRAFRNELFREHFYDYLDAGVEQGWMTGSLLGWYEGGGTIKRMLAHGKTGRQLYDDLYRFIRGKYKPTDRSASKQR